MSQLVPALNIIMLFTGISWHMTHDDEFRNEDR